MDSMYYQVKYSRLYRKKKNKPTHFTCPTCLRKRSYDRVVIHHIIPTSTIVSSWFNSKINEDRNLMYICRTCNLRITILIRQILSDTVTKWRLWAYGDIHCTEEPKRSLKEKEDFNEQLFQETLDLCKKALDKLRGIIEAENEQYELKSKFYFPSCHYQTDKPIGIRFCKVSEGRLSPKSFCKKLRGSEQRGFFFLLRLRQKLFCLGRRGF